MEDKKIRVDNLKRKAHIMALMGQHIRTLFFFFFFKKKKHVCIY
jgi:hypothetical protein